MVVLDGDRKVVGLNSLFEEISGIREDASLGQELGAVARDQALGPFVTDLFDRAPIGGEGVSEDFEFSGISYRVYCGAYGAPGSSAKCYILCFVKAEG